MIEYVKMGDSQAFMVKYSDSLYTDGSLFVAVNWRDVKATFGTIGSAMLSGSICVIIGPRGGLTISSYMSGTAGKLHCKRMAQYVIATFGGKLAASF